MFILVANEVDTYISDCLFLMTCKITKYVASYCEHKVERIGLSNAMPSSIRQNIKSLDMSALRGLVSGV